MSPPGANLRAAAAQFATGTDIEANLAACERAIARGVEVAARVIVLPEFANHVAWYDDAEHAWSVALDLDGDFVARLGKAAAAANAYVQVNCTVRRDNSLITGTNLFFAPDGSLVAASDKQVLMGNENRYLTRATEPRVIVDIDGHAAGLYACMEGVIFEPARSLALRGAGLLLNSLNSFALDEASLHIPVRAAENKVFVVAANKVGPIVPADRLDEVAAGLKVPAAMLHGAGESQIVAPDGTVLAMASRDSEELIWADIDVSAATVKLRPDGTNVMRARRPSLYAAVAQDPAVAPLDQLAPGPASVEVATVSSSGADAVAAVTAAVAGGARLVVLPELADVAVEELRRAVGTTGALVATSIADGASHLGVLVGADGIVHRQPQLHAVARHPWATDLGDDLVVVDSPFGRLALVVGDDSVYPEIARVAAVRGAEVLLVPFAAQEQWETDLGLVERAAENRVNLVAATAAGPVGTCLIVSLPADFTLWVERDRPFDGTINQPDVVRSAADVAVTRGVIHPAHAANKVLSLATDLVDGRPWQLIDALTNL